MTRNITDAVAKIELCKLEVLELGNLNARAMGASRRSKGRASPPEGGLLIGNPVKARAPGTGAHDHAQT